MPEKEVGRRRRILDLQYTAGLSIAESAAQLEMTSNAESYVHLRCAR